MSNSVDDMPGFLVLSPNPVAANEGMTFDEKPVEFATPNAPGRVFPMRDIGAKLDAVRESLVDAGLLER